MSIHKQRSFSCKRGFMASTDVALDSPQTNSTQSNQQSVNVVINNTLTKDKPIQYGKSSVSNEQNIQSRDIDLENIAEDPVNYPSVMPIQTTTTEPVFKPPDIFAPPLNDDVDTTINNATIEHVQTNLDEIKKLVKDKDSLIEALGLIIDIYQCNPLIVNKYLVAEESVLTQLLFLLTNADEITLTKEDIIGGCLCSAANDYQKISKIMVKKGNTILNFKYSYPNVIQFLDERNISWKYVC